MERPYTLSDESVNSFGFRVLTEGIDTSYFEKNPVMLWMHKRGAETGKDGEPMLPIGRWVGLKKQGGLLIAEAEFDEDDTFAMKVKKKAEKGIINATSVYLDALETSEDPTLKLPGQVGPTVTKSILREGSLVDIGSNMNALRLSYKGKPLKLSAETRPEDLNDIFEIKNTSMKKIIALMNGEEGVALADSASEDDVEKQLKAKLSKLKALKEEVEELKAKLKLAEDDKQEAETKLAAQEKSSAAELLVSTALAEKKIMPAEKEAFTKLAAADYESVKNILAQRKAYEPVHVQLNAGTVDKSDADKAKTWDELHKKGKLEALKLSDPNKYADLFEGKYGKKPIEV